MHAWAGIVVNGSLGGRNWHTFSVTMDDRPMSLRVPCATNGTHLEPLYIARTCAARTRAVAYNRAPSRAKLE